MGDLATLADVENVNGAHAGGADDVVHLHRFDDEE